jgi:hypothetical protein
MLYKKAISGVLSLGIFLTTTSIGTLPASSQNTCQLALRKTRNSLISKNVKINYISTFDIRDSGWREYPIKYPVGVSVVFEGKAAESIMASPAFLKSLGHEIVMSCEPVSIVEFGIYSTDYINTLGLSGTNKVEWFECVYPGSQHTDKLPWGYTWCL